MTPAQQKKYDKITIDIQELLDSDTNGMHLLNETINQAAPAVIQMKTQGRIPSLEMLQLIGTRLLAIVIASQVDSSQTINSTNEASEQLVNKNTLK